MQLQEMGPDGNMISMQASSFAMPKFFLMVMWLKTIRQLGSPNVTSTGYGERSHGKLKEGFRYTNKRSSQQIDKQVYADIKA